MSPGHFFLVLIKAMRKLASEYTSEKVGAEIRKVYSWNIPERQAHQQLIRELILKTPVSDIIGVFVFCDGV